MPEVATEPRKSYMTKDQLEAYLRDLRTNRPQRPTGARPMSSAAKVRWSALTGDEPSATVPELENGPPTIVSPHPPPEITRRESRLLQKHSNPLGHKRASTASSILSFGKEKDISEERGANEAVADGAEGTDGKTSVDGGSIRPMSSYRRRRETVGSFRGFSSLRNSTASTKAQSISSMSSTSSTNSDRKKTVSWGSSKEPDSPPPLVMPPCHPPKAEDAPKIEVELAAHFDALSTQPVAPLRINKTDSASVSRCGSSAGEKLPPVLERDSPVSSQRTYTEPVTRRKNITEPWLNEPTQNSKTVYQRNPAPPAPARTDQPTEADEEVLKDLGRKHNPNGTLAGPRELSKNNLRYGAQVLPMHPLLAEALAATQEPAKEPPRGAISTAITNQPVSQKAGAQKAGRFSLTKDKDADSTPPAASPSMCMPSSRPLPRVTQPRTNGTTPTTAGPAGYGTNGTRSTPAIPTVTTPAEPARPPPVPVINLPSDSPPRRTPAIPTISLPSDPPHTASAPTIPTISLPDDPPAPRTQPPIPTISLPDDPPRAQPPIPTISHPTTARTTARPLPRPSPAPSSSRAACNFCRLPIQGRIVSAASLRFHPDCFRCTHCHISLEHVGFFPEPAAARRDRLASTNPTNPPDPSAPVRFYCHLDYHELFSPRCKSCSTPIEGEVVVACGSTWHKGHFFCAECGDPFDESSRFVEKDGYAWCTGCYGRRYSGRCKGCRKPVVETVVRALGGEWCVGCFVCSDCKRPFEDGRFFVHDDEHGREVPVCVRCEQVRLKA